MQKEADVYVPTFFHHMAIFPIFALVRTLIATIRFVPSKSAYEICSAPDRLVGIAWHRNIIFLAKSKIFFRPKLNMAGLVSASKDAAYLVAFFDFMGIKSVRGSYRRRGREAIGDLVEKLGSDSDVFITPDGPRGPACVAKKGFLVVSELSKKRIVVMRFRPKCYFTIPSWDKFIVPLPFSKIFVEAINFNSASELEETAAKVGKTPEEYVSDFMNFKIDAAE